MATFRMAVEVDVSDPRAAAETVANVVTKALREALPALPIRVCGCQEVPVNGGRRAPRTPRNTQPLEGVVMSVAEYLANPQRATEESERAGYVLVKDEAGRTRMVISSNRATERFLNED